LKSEVKMNFDMINMPRKREKRTIEHKVYGTVLHDICQIKRWIEICTTKNLVSYACFWSPIHYDRTITVLRLEEIACADVGFGFPNFCIWFSKFYFKREYLPKLLLGWVTTRSLSLRRFVALPKIVQGRLSTTPPPG
jgi:hypothetical protein